MEGCDRMERLLLVKWISQNALMQLLQPIVKGAGKKEGSWNQNYGCKAELWNVWVCIKDWSEVIYLSKVYSLSALKK